jgi:hypothetical protein
MALELTVLNRNEYQDSYGKGESGKVRSALKAENLTAICNPVV